MENPIILRELFPLFPVLLGGVLTLVGGFAANYLRQRMELKSERKSLAGAFAGEIGAMLSIVERRGYLIVIEHLIQHINETREAWTFHFSARRNYFRVYENNASKIGILSHPLPENIARLYTQAYSILEDIDDMRSPEATAWSADEAVRRLEEMRDLLRDTIQLGHDIVDTINRN